MSGLTRKGVKESGAAEWVPECTKFIVIDHLLQHPSYYPCDGSLKKSPEIKDERNANILGGKQAIIFASNAD